MHGFLNIQKAMNRKMFFVDCSTTCTHVSLEEAMLKDGEVIL